LQIKPDFTVIPMRLVFQFVSVQLWFKGCCS